jgi:hypothetical protein
MPWHAKKTYYKAADEPFEAWEAFVVYRDLEGKRSLLQVEKITGRSRSYIQKASVRWNWKRRVADWEEELDSRLRFRKRLEVDQMRERHIEIAQTTQKVIQSELQKLLRASEAAQDDIIIDPNALARLTKESANLERLTRGEVTERTEGQVAVKHMVDYSNYSDAELKQLRELRLKGSVEDKKDAD